MKTDSLTEVFEKFENDPEYRKQRRMTRPYYDLVLQVIKRRNELGLTQKELAEKAQTYQSRISKIESAEHDIRLSTLVQIAEALHTEVVIQLVPFTDAAVAPDEIASEQMHSDHYAISVAPTYAASIADRSPETDYSTTDSQEEHT